MTNSEPKKPGQPNLRARISDPTRDKMSEFVERAGSSDAQFCERLIAWFLSLPEPIQDAWWMRRAIPDETTAAQMIRRAWTSTRGAEIGTPPVRQLPGTIDSPASRRAK